MTMRIGKRADDVAPAEPVAPIGLGHSDEKARQILDGARDVFLAAGFDAASMNDIARAAGVSKGTLYAYFQSKEALFAALVLHDKRQQAERSCLWGERAGETLTEVLDRIGRTMMATLSKPEHMAQVRTVMAVASKFPEVGRAFYEAGPRYGTERLAATLDRHVASGELVACDTTLAATQFVLLCQGDMFRRQMFGAGDPPTVEEIEATVAAAVRVFLAAYRAA